MKLLIKEYLASLKERNELDAILPDLLSEMGLHVFSRPAIGVRQNGVDLAACGTDVDGVKKVFLFSVKSGDLTRQDWDNGSIQALRPSLNEVIDSYIPNRIPSDYAGLPIAICICVGGDVDQNVDSDLRNYIKQNSKDGIEFQQWDGDRLANLLLSAVLGEQLLGKEARSFFRKAVAMLDEPSAAYDYFAQMLDQMRRTLGERQKDKLTFVRQINLCTWIIYVWSREADNLESAYQCSELAVLWCWKVGSPFFNRKTTNAKAMAAAASNIISLHFAVGNEIIQRRYLPNAHIRDGLSTVVESHEALDINLKLFDIIGRMALNGIWYLLLSGNRTDLSEDARRDIEVELGEYTNGLVSIINNNGILKSPISDSQSTDIGLACLFLVMRKRHDAVRDWMGQMIPACMFAVATNTAYPCAFTEYQELAEHPKPRSDEDYFKRATAGSTLIPTMVIWRLLCDPSAQFGELAKFVEANLSHCTLQLWVPSVESEEHIYTNSEMHGRALLDLKVTDDSNEMLEIVREEIKNSKSVFEGLSAIEFGYWPVILAACRHYRLPIPPHFWEGMIEPENDQ